MNKTIFMTYKNDIPNKVFQRWIELNPNYETDLSLDDKCISFLKENMNDKVSDMFQNIEKGMYKADLWRLCKLYFNSGVYADVDLVPYLKIDELDKDVTFFSCMSLNPNSIFQAFLINKKKQNPLFLCFINSFLMNKPFLFHNGPTYDMYKCLRYNVITSGYTDLVAEKKYYIDKVRIPIRIGKSNTNEKRIDLVYFPDNLEFTIDLKCKVFDDSFSFQIKDNILIVKRIDSNTGWSYNHVIDICIESRECIYLFTENNGPNNDWVTGFVSDKGKKILDSRDLEYHKNGGW